jgi:hypothetical protein
MQIWSVTARPTCSVQFPYHLNLSGVPEQQQRIIIMSLDFSRQLGSLCILSLVDGIVQKLAASALKMEIATKRTKNEAASSTGLISNTSISEQSEPADVAQYSD